MSAVPIPEAFDLEAVYDAEIFPLMEQVISICHAHNLPMFAAFAYASDGEGDVQFCTTALPGPEGRRIEALGECVLILRDGRHVEPDHISIMITDQRGKRS